MGTTTTLRRWVGRVSFALGVLLASAAAGRAATYYVRQTVGDDAHDGLSAATAWQHVAKLSTAMHAGDTAYVGPGLYREEISVLNDGALDARIAFIADTTGQHTGDPPGVVMLVGSDPVDETIFVPHAAAGVYMAKLEARAWGVVEMDGPQRRYGGTRETAEHARESMPEVDVVAKLPATYYWDEASQTLYLHTSDGRPPREHELELIHRGNGIGMSGKRFVTVMGFTFRSMQDAGINFFRGSGDGIAIGNTAWGSRQGIRVYGATNVHLYGNTLFRNENSGAYFAAASTSGVTIGNISYENIKGLRWSSQSGDALAVDNVLFDNLERGLAIENVDRVVLRRNVLANNVESQLLVWQAAYSSEANCFAVTGTQRIADFFPFRLGDQIATLQDYQRAHGQDLHSTSGGCAPLPAKVDVQRLHAETQAYAERARAELRGETPSGSASGGVGRWLQHLLGW